MEFALIIWFISSLNALGTLSMLLSAVSALSLVGLAAYRDNLSYWTKDYTEAISTNTRRIKKVFATLVISAFAAAIIPSQKIGWMMLGAYAAQTTWQSSTGQKLQKIAEIKLEEILDEVTKQAKIRASEMKANNVNK